jgi:hypothetical protein
LTLVVKVSNQAGTAADVLDRAKAQANRIFMDAGVGIAWLDAQRDPEPRCGGLHVLVTLLPPETVRRLSTEGLSETALGSAAEGTGRVVIYPQRVLELAARIHTSAGELLGRVIAHELGHMLLPPGHSPLGIMTAGLDTDPRTSAHFTRSQTRAIRERIEATATGPGEPRGCGTSAVARER